MAAAASGRIGCGGWLARAVAVGVVLAASGCERRPAGPGPAARSVGPRPVDAGAADGAARVDADGARPEEEPANLLRTAEFAWTQQEDRELARGLLRVALEAISRRLGTPVQLVAALAQGLADPDFAALPLAQVALAAGSDRVAVGHGRLLSIVDLHGGNPGAGPAEPAAQLIRLAEHPAVLRRVVLDRDGERVATLADDGIARLLYVSGDPGYQWPLLSPPDPAAPELPGTEAAYRASWLDFSPDARFLFLADSGVPGAVSARPAAALPTSDPPAARPPAAPPALLRRLRVFTTDRGQPLLTLTADGLELVDYTARRDGTVAVLFAGRPPKLYQTRTGAELGLTSSLRGAAAQACLDGSRQPLLAERGWVVSPDRRWLATLAAPATLCLWDLDARALAAAPPLTGTGSGRLRLESLLGDRTADTVVLSTADRLGGRHSYLLDAQTGQRKAELAGLAAVMPLDDGGALLSGSIGARRAGLLLYRLHPDHQLVRLTSPQLQATRCLADFPDAVAGDGGLALFSPLDAVASSDCPPALVELRPPSSATVRRLAPLGGVAIAAAGFVGPRGRLVIVDAAARLQVLAGTQVQYATPPAAAAVTRLGFAPQGAGDQLLLGRADGQTAELWTTGGTLRPLPAAAAPTAPVGARRELAGPDAPLRTVSADGRLRAEIVTEHHPGPPLPPALRLRDAAGAVRWQVVIPGLPTATALAFTPDASLLIVGGVGGMVVWLRVSDGSLRLQLQLVPGGAVALGPDGRFELLGQVDRPEDYVFCRAGTYQIPFALCTGRLRTRGLVTSALRL